MDRDQLSGIFDHLCAQSPDPARLLESLTSRATLRESPTTATLYLPMYSMGMGAATISVRIDWLQQNGWNLERLTTATPADCAAIAGAALDNAATFGMPRRVNELIHRAREISDFGVEDLEATLTPRRDWRSRELLQPLRALRRFTGIGPAAALHILMELGWGLVKPDRHICRFLSRLGGQWSDFFPHPGAQTLDEEGRLPFLEAWRENCEHISTQLRASPLLWNGTQFAELSPRQIDWLIMLYTQNVAHGDGDWRPPPLCTSDPDCHTCGVPGCAARLA